jgi:hypothetical protein
MVVVKVLADENMVTYLRVKLESSDKEIGGEGQDMLMKLEDCLDLQMPE